MGTVHGGDCSWISSWALLVVANSFAVSPVFIEVNWPKIVARYEFNTGAQLVFFIFANQQIGCFLYYYMDFPSGLKSSANIRLWFSYSSCLAEKILHKPFLFCVGIAGARWLFDWNPSMFTFLIFKFSIILFPLPHCSFAIDFPVSSITDLDFQQGHLLLNLLHAAISFTKYITPMSTYLVVHFGTALWRFFRGVRNCFCSHGSSKSKLGKDVQMRMSLSDSFSSCF